MKKAISWMMVFVFALAITGCAKKTASEQLRDDMNKAQKDIKGMLS